MAEFEFTINKGKDTIEEFIQKLRLREDEFEQELKIATKDAALYMRNYINRRKKRKGEREQGERGLGEALSKRMTVERYGDRISVGFGEIAYLKIHHSYWRVLNDGGMIAPRTMGFFGNRQAPSGRQRNQVFHYNPKGLNKDGTPYGKGTSFLLYPKKPARPIRYISATRRYLSSRVNKLVKQLTTRFK